MKTWSAVDLIAMGRENLRNGQFEAAKQIGMAVAKDPQFLHAALALTGEAYVASGDWGTARKFYEMAIADAVRGKHYEEKIRIIELLSEISVEGETSDTGEDGFRIDPLLDKEQIEAANQSRNNRYRMIRNILGKYDFKDTVVDLFDKVPATENDMSWRQPDTETSKKLQLRAACRQFVSIRYLNPARCFFCTHFPGCWTRPLSG